MIARRKWTCPSCSNVFEVPESSRPDAQAVCPACQPQADDWYCRVMGEVVGPVSFEKLKELVAAADTPVRQATDGEWRSAAHVPGLRRPSQQKSIAPQPAAEIPSDRESDSNPRKLEILIGAGAALALLMLAASGWFFHARRMANLRESSESALTEADEERAAVVKRLKRSETRLAETEKQSKQLTAEQKKEVQNLKTRIAKLQADEQLSRNRANVLTSQLNVALAMIRRAQRGSAASIPVGNGKVKPSVTLEKLSPFKKQLAIAWASALARKQQKRSSLIPNRGFGRGFSPSAIPSGKFIEDTRKALIRFLQIGTPEAIVRYAQINGLAFPKSAAMPKDFIAAKAKVEKEFTRTVDVDVYYTASKESAKKSRLERLGNQRSKLRPYWRSQRYTLAAGSAYVEDLLGPGMPTEDSPPKGPVQKSSFTASQFLSEKGVLDRKISSKAHLKLMKWLSDGIPNPEFSGANALSGSDGESALPMGYPGVAAGSGSLDGTSGQLVNSKYIWRLRVRRIIVFSKSQIPDWDALEKACAKHGVTVVESLKIKLPKKKRSSRKRRRK